LFKPKRLQATEIQDVFLLETVSNISCVLLQESIVIKTKVLQNDIMHPWQCSKC